MATGKSNEEHQHLKNRCIQLESKLKKQEFLEVQLLEIKRSQANEHRQTQLIQNYWQNALSQESKEQFISLSIRYYQQIFGLPRLFLLEFQEKNQTMHILGKDGYEELDLFTNFPFSVEIFPSNTAMVLDSRCRAFQQFVPSKMEQAIFCPFYDVKGKLKGGVLAGLFSKDVSYGSIPESLCPLFTIMASQTGTLLSNYDSVESQRKVLSNHDEKENLFKEAKTKILSENQVLREQIAVLKKMLNQQEFLLNVFTNDQLKQEEKISNSIEELKVSEENLEEFAYVVSHDLKSPLRSIVGLAQKLEEEISGTNQVYTSQIKNRVKKVNQLINDFLIYTKVSTHTSTKEHTNFNNILGYTNVRLAEAIAQQEVTILSNSLPSLVVNQYQMKLLILNLLDNSIKFRSPDRKPVIKLKVEKEEGAYIFSIQDNGIGIDKKEQKNVFQLFQKAHQSDIYEGSGIGLSLCKAIVENHKGRIWFESKKGQGTTFYFSIPETFQS